MHVGALLMLADGIVYWPAQKAGSSSSRAHDSGNRSLVLGLTISTTQKELMLVGGATATACQGAET